MINYSNLSAIRNLLVALRQTVDGDVLVLCVSVLTKSIVLTALHKWALISHDEVFNHLYYCQCRVMIKRWNILPRFLTIGLALRVMPIIKSLCISYKLKHSASILQATRSVRMCISYFPCVFHTDDLNSLSALHTYRGVSTDDSIMELLFVSSVFITCTLLPVDDYTLLTEIPSFHRPVIKSLSIPITHHSSKARRPS